MLVSVIIPAFNAEKTIFETVESVIDQDYKNIEIIVVNDGSWDETQSILERFGNKIKIINTKNNGVSSARTVGLKFSKGDYIQYLDADDLLTKGKLSKQLSYLLESQGDVAYGDWQKFHTSPDYKIVSEAVSNQIDSDHENHLFTSFWAPPAALLYSRKIVNLIHWKDNLPVIQDARYLFDAARANAKFIYTPGIMAMYRSVQPHSLSSRSKIAFVNDCFTNAKEVYNLWINEKKLSSKRKDSVIGVLRYCIHQSTILNWQLANEIITFLLEIEPTYIPSQPGFLRSFSKFFGYKNAEKFAMFKRRINK